MSWGCVLSKLHESMYLYYKMIVVVYAHVFHSFFVATS